MKKLYLIVGCLIFFLIGELLIRADIKYDLLNSKPQKIAIKLDETPIKKQLDQGNFKIDSLKYRILVVGDSYIYGGGINHDKKFSKILDSMLKTDRSIRYETQILDVSRPSNNTLDNFNYLNHYTESFKPNMIIWFYNFNDIIGGLDNKTKGSTIENNDTELKTNVPKQHPKEIAPLKKFTKQVYRSSKLLEFCSSKLQKELKLKGIVLPFGDFYHLTNKVYNENSVNWKKSKELIKQIEEKSKVNNTSFILYKVPEFNLLNNENLFEMVDNSFNDFSDNHPYINYINGIEDFKNVVPEDYMLSRYDGHPNEKAHKKIAKRIFNEIKNELSLNQD